MVLQVYKKHAYSGDPTQAVQRGQPRSRRACHAKPKFDLRPAFVRLKLWCAAAQPGSLGLNLTALNFGDTIPISEESEIQIDPTMHSDPEIIPKPLVEMVLQRPPRY